MKRTFNVQICTNQNCDIEIFFSDLHFMLHDAAPTTIPISKYKLYLKTEQTLEVKHFHDFKRQYVKNAECG